MLAQRLARLVRDEDAQKWLQLELHGYAPGTSSDELGTCARYALRWFPDGKVYTESLPEIEARALGQQLVLERMPTATIGAPVENFIQSGATKDVMNSSTAGIVAARNALVVSKGALARMKAALHRYASDTLIALEFGDIAEDLFEGA